MNIICLLSVDVNINTLNFLEQLGLNKNYDIYIVIDNNDFDISNINTTVKIIKVNNIECEQSGYKGSVLWFKDRACSRDKALYYFNRNNIEYNYIWIIEEDVFIPTIKTIENIDLKYQNGDLLVSDNIVIHKARMNWHWKLVNNRIKLKLPYSRAMICAIRCSKKLLLCIDEYVKKYNDLFLDEVLFNTIAIHNNLNIKCILELKTIFYKKEWKFSDISIYKLYHPIKDINKQLMFRQNINKLF
jgi:hypothetical protein